MKSVQQLLDALAERAGSDRKAAVLLGITQGAFSKWRRSVAFPDDDQAVLIAEALQLPPAFVLALVRADRTSSRKARVEWLRIAERFAAVVLVSATAGILPAPSPTIVESPSNPCVLCKTRRCPIHSRQLGRSFGAVLHA